jgi:hypothetical protein
MYSKEEVREILKLEMEGNPSFLTAWLNEEQTSFTREQRTGYDIELTRDELLNNITKTTKKNK